VTSDPERLIAAEDPALRELVRSARADGPEPELRAASMSSVLAEYRQRRARRRLAGAALGSVAALAAVFALWLRFHPTPETQLAREVPSSSSRNVATALPPRASSARALPPELQPCTPAVRADGSAPLIDDFEDADTRIAALEHRAGFWSTSNDGTGSEVPAPGGAFPMSRIPGGRGTSQFALHVRGGKFSKWGVLLSADLSARRCYDASAYGGLAFWARGRGRVDVIAKMTQTAPEEYGGSCTHDCYDGHRKTIDLSGQWHEERITWAELEQRGFGPPLAFDPHSLLALEFNSLPENTPFEYWIDDLRFLPR
jgi:hypothetical protein